MDTISKRGVVSIVTLCFYAAATAAFFCILPSRSSMAGAQTGASIAAGRNLYRQYCASCHGTSAKGDGPTADALKVAPPDLTSLQQPGEQFPSLRVINSIEGEKLVSAHGARQMPVWGRIFRRERRGKTKEPIYILNLVNYLEPIQTNREMQR